MATTRTRGRVRSGRARCRCGSACRRRSRSTIPAAWAAALAVAPADEIVEVDLEPFLAAGRMLYAGPWLAERYAAVGHALDAPDVDPVVREVIGGGAGWSAADAFRAREVLAALAARAARDLGCRRRPAPAHGAVPSDARGGRGRPDRRQRPPRHVHDVRQPARPLRGLDPRRAALGRAAVRRHAARARVRRRRAARSRRALAVRCRRARRARRLRRPHARSAAQRAAARARRAVRPRDRRRRRRTGSTPCPAASGPGSCGLRTAGRSRSRSGASPRPRSARCWRRVPPPLAIGTVELADGSQPRGFLCEPHAVAEAPDISLHGSWQAYLEMQEAPAGDRSPAL